MINIHERHKTIFECHTSCIAHLVIGANMERALGGMNIYYRGTGTLKNGDPVSPHPLKAQSHDT